MYEHRNRYHLYVYYWRQISEVQWMYFLTLCRPFTATSCFKDRHMYVVTHRSPTLTPMLCFVILFFLFAESERRHRFHTNSFIIDGRGKPAVKPRQEWAFSISCSRRRHKSTSVTWLVWHCGKRKNVMILRQQALPSLWLTLWERYQCPVLPQSLQYVWRPVWSWTFIPLTQAPLLNTFYVF